MIRPVHMSQRGATLTLFVRIAQDTESEITGDETARASLKFLSEKNPQDKIPADDVEAILDLTVTYSAAAGSQAAGWHIQASGEQTEPLTRGYYITDLRIETADGGIIQTTPIAVDLTGRVTKGVA